MQRMKALMTLSLLLSTLILISCDDDAPAAENEEEIITNVTLTFTPQGGGNAVTATAVDPDGEGPRELEIVTDISLAANTTYTLSLDLLNSIEGESITEEILEEDEEHMFFFGWTADFFSNPTGDGNIGEGNRSDNVNYLDQDAMGNPLGLETSWTTGEARTGGSFRIILKHQPNVKSETSDSQDGESDVDISWGLTIN